MDLTGFIWNQPDKISNVLQKKREVAIALNVVTIKVSINSITGYLLDISLHPGWFSLKE